MSETEQVPRATGREWAGLVVLALPTLILAVDLSVLYLALPSIGQDLRPSSVQQLWVTDIYGFMLAGFFITMGSLGDRIGRRRLLLIGATGFAIASVVAAFAPNIEVLIGARAAMGVAGATLAPSSLALITSMFVNPQQRATAMAAWMTCFVAGNAVGPLIGGGLLSFFDWGSVFLVAVPIMALLLVAGPQLLPEFKATDPEPLDLVSVAMSLAALFPFVYGLKELARDGLAGTPALLVLVGIGLGVMFLLRQHRIPSPLIDLGLFRNRSFSTVLTMLVAGGIFLGGATLLVTQYLQLVAGLSPMKAGLAQLPAIIAMTVGSMTAPSLAKNVRPGVIMTIGLLISGVGYAILTQVTADSLWLLVLGWAVALGGAGLPAGLGMGLLFASVPPEKAGSASAVQQTGTELGLALGIASIGSVALAVYRSSVGSATVSGAPAEVTAAMRDNLAAALGPLHDFPEALAAARDAYSDGLNVAAVIAVVVQVAIAVGVYLGLRSIPPFAAADAAPADTPGAASPPEAATDHEPVSVSGRSEAAENQAAETGGARDDAR